MRTLRGLVPVVSVLSLLGCGGMPTDPELSCDGTSPGVTLAGAVQDEVFAPACSSCHGANYTYGDYSTAATTLASTANKKSLYAGMAGSLMVVAPGNLANSSLWLKVLGGTAKARTGPRGENVFGKMPNDGQELTPKQKQRLKDWICGGAK